MSIPHTASVITPTAITDAMLVSCTVAEPAAGETAWNAATSYTVGQEVVRTTTHRRYRRIVAGATPTAPESDTVNWLALGATNRWAQFDKKIGTTTSAATVVTTVLTPGSAEGLAALELTGTSLLVSIKDQPGGTVVYTRTISLDATVVSDVYDWMYADYAQRRNVVLTDLPGQYPSAEITVTVNSTSGAAIGVLVVGRMQTIGSTEYGAGAGIINWGKVTDDGFGNREWIEGDYSNRMTLPLVANRSDMARIHRLLAGLRSTPAIYVGTEIPSLESFISYGVFRDLYMTVPDFPTVRFNLEVDGLSNI